MGLRPIFYDRNFDFQLSRPYNYLIGGLNVTKRNILTGVYYIRY